MAPDGQEPSEDFLMKLNDLLSYRGPNDGGVATHGNVGFIHRNLQTHSIDIGHQPLSTSRKLSLILDGFISNYSKLYEDLSKNFTFESACPSEIIFPLYEAKGVEFSHHIKGMFACALFDGYAEELYLTRDISGVKPLYYTWIEKQFVFSSSLHALQSFKFSCESSDKSSIEPEMNTIGVKESLQYGAVLKNETIFKDIFTVHPGEILIIHDCKIIRSIEGDLKSLFSAPKKTLSEHKKNQIQWVEEQITKRSHRLSQSGIIVNQLGDYLVAAISDSLALSGVEKKGVVLSDQYQKEGSKQLYLRDDEVEILDEKAFWRFLPETILSMQDPYFQPDLVLETACLKAFSEKTKIIFSGFGADIAYGDKKTFRYAKRHDFLGGSLVPKQGRFSPFQDTPLFLGQWRQRLQNEVSLMKSCQKLSRIQKSQLIEYKSKFVKSHLSAYESIMAHNGVEAHCLFLEKESLETTFSLGESAKISNGLTGVGLYELMNDFFPQTQVIHSLHARRDILDSWLVNKASRIGTLVAHQPEIESLFSSEFVRLVFSCKTKKHISCAWALLMYALWHQAFIVKVDAIPDTLSFLSAR